MRSSILLVILALASPSHADPRDGANHRLGDDSFVAAFGRVPDARDSEELRMATHLAYVHAMLLERPATRPELATRRAELLGYLGDYRAKGTTPINTRLAYRSPVFIDDDGRICAVGYLIERSVGRALPERIAASHRHAFLEDIAAAMPEVASWVETSGLTLDELASIQPGYRGSELPWVEQWGLWGSTIEDMEGIEVPRPPKNGRYQAEESFLQVRGRFRDGKMHGRWTKQTKAGALVGSGTFHHGSGRWRSLYPDGKLLAAGEIIDNKPNGDWKIYHPSGNLAAQGRMSSGQRHGSWTFYYDTKRKTPIAKGEFKRGSYARGRLVGTWRHYKPDGSLLATAQTGGEKSISLAFARTDRVRRQVRFGGREEITRGTDRLYRLSEKLYDARGFLLERGDEAWTAYACEWPAAMKRAMKRGDLRAVVKAHEEDPTCGDATAVDAERGKQLDAMVADHETPLPAFVVDQRVDERGERATTFDSMLVERLGYGFGPDWEHVNRPFMDLFVSLPGYDHPMLCPGDCKYRWAEEETAAAQ
jgi:hypothetical protein